MDIRSYFSRSSTPSTSVAPSNSDSNSEEERDISPGPVSVHLIVHIQRNNPSIVLQVLAAAGSTIKGGKDFTWLEYHVDCDGTFCKLHKTYGRTSLNEQVVYRQQGHSPTGRKLLRR